MSKPARTARKRPPRYDTCPACGQGPSFLIYCRERRPGANGRMAQSFGGSYRICEACVDRLFQAKAIALDEPADHRYERRLTVLAASYAWLRRVRGGA